MFVFTISACCSVEKYQDLLNSRLGISENELVEQIGNPDSAYDTGEKRSLEYKYSNSYCTNGWCETDWCTTQYMIKDGKVDMWRYRGNYCCIH